MDILDMGGVTSACIKTKRKPQGQFGKTQKARGVGNLGYSINQVNRFTNESSDVFLGENALNEYVKKVVKSRDLSPRNSHRDEIPLNF